MWGKHISLAAIFERKHISLVICVRGNTYHCDTGNKLLGPITRTIESKNKSKRFVELCQVTATVHVILIFHSNLMKMPDFFNLNNFNPDLLVGGEGHRGI